MTTHSGAVLVAVLLVSLSIWLLLAGLLLVTRLQFEVAVASREHAVAHALAQQLIEERRAGATWPDDAGGDSVGGEIGRCIWSLTRFEHDEVATRYEAHVAFGRAQVVLDGTVHGGSSSASASEQP